MKRRGLAKWIPERTRCQIPDINLASYKTPRMGYRYTKYLMMRKILATFILPVIIYHYDSDGDFRVTKVIVI